MQTLATLTILLPGLGALLGALTYLLLPAKPEHLGKAAHAGHGHNDHHGHGTALHDALAMALTTGGVIAAALGAWTLFLSLTLGTLEPFTVEWLNWIAVPGANAWQVSFGAMVDRLTATMLIVVTTVSACVHVYSIGYMHEDPSRRRFFIYLSMFTLAMLLLVSAPNLIQMFLGWEGVGVCSYLLIGFWHYKASANAASIKAFIVNRVADAAMLVGLFTLLATFGSFNYADIFARVEDVATQSPNIINFIAVFLFIGAMGKSAQFGLHTWLPDAMEGPTPVSALIHAATMVTAGVFLLCRMSPLYEAAPDVLHIVGWVGAITAIFAATVGLTQTDIKRVIAYSTCSQLGYMFFAIGVSAYPAAMFHLTTHAFFKALLFLGAGSVIHAMHHEQNIFKMGALKTVLPVTYALMWLGSLALAGIPPFAGFFSKDLILESAFMAPEGWGTPLYVLGAAAAFLTALYGFRIIFMTFNGKFMGDKDVLHHAHESPWVILGPMLPLAFGAMAGGFLLKEMGTLEWWHGAIVIAEHHDALHASHHTPWLAKFAPLALALCGIGLSYYFFAKHREKAKAAAKNFAVPYAVSFNKWYVDEIYTVLWVRPTAFAARLLSATDKNLVDGVVNGAARTVADTGLWLRLAQTGYVYHYGFVMLLALVGGLAWLLWGSF